MEKQLLIDLIEYEIENYKTISQLKTEVIRLINLYDKEKSWIFKDFFEGKHKK